MANDQPDGRAFWDCAVCGHRIGQDDLEEQGDDFRCPGCDTPLAG
jgi:rubrerythrin